MRKIKDVLRLKFDSGLSDRQIAQSVAVARSTIGEYVRRFRESGLPWPLPDTVLERELEARLFPPPPPVPTAARAVPDWAWVHQELRKPGVTLFLLWQEYRAAHPDGFRYSWFCEHYRLFAGRLDLVMRQEHRPGEKCFVDYAGHTVAIVDRHTGEQRTAQIFVGVLGASNYTYAEASWTQGLADWIGAHVRMLDYFGGAMAVLVPDNLKSGVSKACRYEPDINPSYQEFALHYGIAVVPARVRRPRDKAKVEGGVLLVERWILARLRHQTFFSLATLNTSIRELLQALNTRPFKKLPGSRAEHFAQHEQLALRPLPRAPYVFAEWKKARVNVDYHIEVADYVYSVPYQRVGQVVDVRYTEHTVEIFHQNERIASHPRRHSGRRHVTIADHMPERHRHMVEWTPERFIRWAASMGEHVPRFIAALLAARPHPQQGFRAALGVLRLGKSYGHDRLNAACRRALVLKVIDYRSIESILKHRLDQQPLPDDAPAQPPLQHDNVRGPTYYQ